MNGSSALALGIKLDAGDNPHDVIEVMTWEPFAAGRLPFARTTQLPRVRLDAPLLPPGVAPIRVVEGDHRRSCLADGDGWRVWSTRWRDRSADVVVVATSEALA